MTEASEEVLGLVLCGSHPQSPLTVSHKTYQFGPEASDTSCRALLHRVAANCKLIFYDAAHPQLTEPGAWVSLVRTPEGLIAQLSNHGWSSSWVPISDDEAIRWIALCMPYSALGSSTQVSLADFGDRIEVRRISRWRWASCRRYLNKRLASAA